MTESGAAGAWGNPPPACRRWNGMTPLFQLAPFADLGPWPAFAVALAVAVGGALLLHAVVYGALHRVRQRAPGRLPLNGHLVTQTDRPARWVLVLIALQAAVVRLPPDAAALVQPCLLYTSPSPRDS